MQAVILMRQPQAPDIGMAGSVGTVVSRSKVKETENQGENYDSESQFSLDPAREAYQGFG